GPGAGDRYTVITKCGHQFHLDCLQAVRESKDENMSCPMCREELPPGITPGKKSAQQTCQLIGGPAASRGAFQPPRYIRPQGAGLMMMEEEGGEPRDAEEEKEGEEQGERRRGRNRSKACAVM
ncbi:hypothetical protein TrRE_jg8201, partial [Triparma retinervis]